MAPSPDMVMLMACMEIIFSNIYCINLMYKGNYLILFFAQNKAAHIEHCFIFIKIFLNI